jgi:hypothetical protein
MPAITNATWVLGKTGTGPGYPSAGGSDRGTSGSAALSVTANSVTGADETENEHV